MTMVRRPSPEELLQGVMNALTKKVGPHVADPYAKQQLGTAVALLDYVRQHFDTAVKDALDEIASLESALRGSLGALAAAGEYELGGRIETLVAAVNDDMALSALMARGDALQAGMLEVALLAERAAERGEPPGALFPALRAELVALNARRAARPFAGA